MLLDLDLLAAAIRLATPLAYAALGVLICERAGVLNVGAEGIMLMGAAMANIVAALTGNLALGVLAGIVAGFFCGIVTGAIVINLKADQLVVGIGFNIFAVGMSSFLKEMFFGVHAGPNASRTSPFPVLDGSWLASLPLIGPILAPQTVLSVFVLILPAVIGVALWRTGFGLATRVVGENAQMADTLGISVPRVRLGAFAAGSALIGLGGADLALAEVNYFISNMTAGRGYIALAVVVLGRWNPYPTLFVCLLLGLTDALQFRFQTLQLPVPPQFWVAMPYVVALLLLLSARGRAIAPADDGKPYIRN